MNHPTRPRGDLTRDVVAILGSLSFVCPTGMDIARRLIVAELGARRPDLVVAGGADGVEKLAVAVAGEMGIPFHELIPGTAGWDGPRGIKATNVKLTGLSTRLLRISCVRFRTHGSGWAADRAERVLRRPVRHIVINANGTVDDSGWPSPPEVNP